MLRHSIIRDNTSYNRTYNLNTIICSTIYSVCRIAYCYRHTGFNINSNHSRLIKNDTFPLNI